MKTQADGRIINFCSLQGVDGEPLFGDYDSTKEAIRGLTRTAAREWGRFGVRVNCIAPAGLSPAHIAQEEANPEFGRRLRKAIALGYVGDPEEDIGGAVLMLCRSEEHTSELQSLMRISYAVFCLKKKTQECHRR